MNRQNYVTVLLMTAGLCMACACQDRGEPRARVGRSAVNHANPTVDASRGVSAIVAREDVSDVLKRWKEAQDRGDFAGYSALYAEEFHGVRRSGPRVLDFDRDGWLQDRRRMFASPMTVSMEGLTLTERAGEVHAAFEQRWQSKRYADRGPKTMTFRRNTPGRWLIVHEELLSSTPVSASPDASVGSPPTANRRDEHGWGYFIYAAGTEAKALHLGAVPSRTSSSGPLEVLARSPENVAAYDGTPSERVVITQALDAKEDDARSLVGARVRLFGGAGGVCETEVKGLAIAVSISEAERAVRGPIEDIWRAMTPWRRTKVATLATSPQCRGAAWAQRATAPEPVFGKLDEKALRTELFDRYFTESTGWERLYTAYQLEDLDAEFGNAAKNEAKIPPSRRLTEKLVRQTFRTVVARNSDGKPAVAMIFGTFTTHQVALAFSVQQGHLRDAIEVCGQPSELIGAADLDGDGRVEIVYATGGRSTAGTGFVGVRQTAASGEGQPCWWPME